MERILTRVKYEIKLSDFILHMRQNFSMELLQLARAIESTKLKLEFLRLRVVSFYV